MTIPTGRPFEVRNPSFSGRSAMLLISRRDEQLENACESTAFDRRKNGLEPCFYGVVIL